MRNATLTVVSGSQSSRQALYSGDAYGRIRVWDAASVQHGSKAVLGSGMSGDRKRSEQLNRVPLFKSARRGLLRRHLGFGHAGRPWTDLRGSTPRGFRCSARGICFFSFSNLFLCFSLSHSPMCALVSWLSVFLSLPLLWLLSVLRSLAFLPSVSASFPHWLGDAAGTLRLWDAERSTLLREVSTAMSCCAAVSALGMRRASGLEVVCCDASQASHTLKICVNFLHWSVLPASCRWWLQLWQQGPIASDRCGATVGG